jgi:hypothetical protein
MSRDFVSFNNFVKTARQLICGLISLQLLLAYPVPAAADGVWSDAYFRQYVASKALDQLMPQLKGTKTRADLEKLLPKDLAVRDLETIRKNLRGKITKFTRLNRGLAFELSGKKYTIVVEDPQTMRMRINGKADFTFMPGNPLEIQAEVLSKALEKSETSMLDLLLPKAHAIMGFDDLIYLTVISIIFTGAMNKVVEAIFGDGLLEYAKDWWCDGKTEATGPATAKFCASIFKWRAEHLKDKQVPTAKDAPADNEGLVKKSEVKEQCKKSGSDAIVNETTSADKKKRTVTTIKFEKDKPKQVIFEISIQMNPRDKQLTQKIVLDLDDTRSIKEARDGTGKVLATSDKTAIGTMNATQVSKNAKLLDETNKLLKPAIEIVEGCNLAADKAIAKAAGEPATALASEVAVIESAPMAPVVPSVPTPATK